MLKFMELNSNNYIKGGTMKIFSHSLHINYIFTSLLILTCIVTRKKITNSYFKIYKYLSTYYTSSFSTQKHIIKSDFYFPCTDTLYHNLFFDKV